MLVGRERERERIRGLVAAARVGESGALVLRGEAGIGKSALLEDAVAAMSGMSILRATGSAAEAEVPFGGLLQVLRPALAHLKAIPGPQADALATALALREGTGGTDRFAIGAATLSLLSRLAEDQPVAVIVDDAHLLDRPSAQALAFAARRLLADPVVLLATALDDQPCALDEAGLCVLQVGGLSPAATGELAAAHGRRLEGPLLDRLRHATGGNPLALMDLLAGAHGPDVVISTPHEAPVLVPLTLARTFARRADGLSHAARTALLVAAAGGDDLALVSRACALMDVPVSALSEAEALGLVRIDARGLTFRHNLVRSALYAEAGAGARRAVHRALAAALESPQQAHDHGRRDEDGDRDGVDRRAWHLGRAATGPDEAAAAALDAAGVRARDRSAHAVAAGAFERAARLSPDEDTRIRRLVDAADSAWQAGSAERSQALVTEVSMLQPPLALQVSVAFLHGTVAARTGSVETARDVLMSAGAGCRLEDPDAAILLFADAILTCFFLADTATILDAARQIDQLLGRAASERSRWVGEMAAGVAAVLTGRGGARRLREALLQIQPGTPLRNDPRVGPWLVSGPLFLRESGTGRDLIDSVVADLRRRGAVADLPYLLFHQARDQATTDRWEVAEATYTEGISLARETGHSTDLAACLAGLSWLHARQGRDTTCRAHAEESLRISGAHHISLFRVWSFSALGELDLGLGRPEAAIARLQRLEALLEELGLDDVDLSPAPELVEALVHVGLFDEAAARAQVYAARAAAKGQPWSLARAGRTLGLTADPTAMEEHFAGAMEHHGRTLDSFEVARTQLAHGSRLRRARRRVDAREPLRSCLASFERLGAVPWADRAAVELRATGETARRRGASVLRDLTPQELQIARLLGSGRTTKEAAAGLFLSPKTVEYHLRHVYIKLGVRSRAELATHLLAHPDP